MDPRNITVTEIISAVTVYSQKGRLDEIKNRAHFGISLCIDGQITYIQNGKEYVSDKGCAIILPKGGTYYIKRNKTGAFPVINFECTDSFTDTVTVIPLEDAKELILDYEKLKRDLCFEGNRAKVFSVFYGMLHKIGRDVIPRELAPAIQKIKSTYADPTLTNERLASECNISEVYFRRLFKEHFGISPKQYVIDVRLQRAKQLLAEGKLSLSLIAEASGFTNQYHLSRLFKERVGLTPSEYRKKNLSYGI
jgi:AraC-like DNA-binding protein